MKNVLLVDDDSICNFLNKKTLQSTGRVKSVETVSNGQEAIRLFQSYLDRNRPFPDIVLLDINMPIMDGFEFLEAFNEMTLPGKGKIKVIIVSSSNDRDEVTKAKSLGAWRYVNKPLSFHAALEVLHD
jgi:CheY-like chemotaxis protein